MTLSGEQVQAFVDAHCHIDLYKSPQAVVGQAEAQRTYTIAVTNAPSVFSHTAALAAGSKYVRAALGLHPELVHSHGQEIDQFPHYLPETRYVGEVGLDYTTTDEDKRIAQRQVFTRIADWVNQSGDKVLTVHSRRAASDVVALLSGIKARVILHWFTGTDRELEDAASRGFFFSVNSAMLRSAKSRALAPSHAEGEGADRNGWPVCPGRRRAGDPDHHQNHRCLSRGALGAAFRGGSSQNLEQPQAASWNANLTEHIIADAVYLWALFRSAGPVPPSLSRPEALRARHLSRRSITCIRK